MTAPGDHLTCVRRGLPGRHGLHRRELHLGRRDDRNRLAAFDAAGGWLLPWNPNANGTVRALGCPRAPPECASLGLHRGRRGGRRTPAQLLTRLRTAPVAVDQLDPEVLADCICSQVRLLRSLLGSIADLDRALAAAPPEHPKATVLQPLPRIGQINLAQVLAEVGPIPDRASTLTHAAVEVGATPVTTQSGKGALVQVRWAATTRARNALGSFADDSRHASPWAAHLYRQARRCGKRHPQAIRILMRAWLRVI